MEIDILILVLDILGSAGLGFAAAKQISRDLKKAAAAGATVPTVLFGLACIINLQNPQFVDIFTKQLTTYIVGAIFGEISANITAQIRFLFIRC